VEHRQLDVRCPADRSGLTTRLLYLAGSSNPVVAVLSALEAPAMASSLCAAEACALLMVDRFSCRVAAVAISLLLQKHRFRFALRIHGARPAPTAAGAILD
jgi:hypothetical protein